MSDHNNTKKELRIRNALLDWSAHHPRYLPWKADKDPYRIWVSEIILQQTRVEQGLPYFERFIDRYPDLMTLAATSEDALMKVWEGLGYYRRAKHMLMAAREIALTHGGVFPQSYDAIRNLKGVGSYTASAIASFAFDLPFVVIDGNAIRVITRLYGITGTVSETKTRNQIAEIAELLLDKHRPAAFNQAIMDFGALHCKPTNPSCLVCPLANDCQAYQENQVALIPVKKARKQKRGRHFYYLVPVFKDQVYIRKRTDGDIWPNLFEFLLFESNGPQKWATILPELDLPICRSSSQARKYKQILSHQIIHAEFLIAELETDASILRNLNYTAVKTKKIRNFAFPKVIDCFLADKDVILNLENLNW